MERQDAKPAKNAKARHFQRSAVPRLDALRTRIGAVIGAAICAHFSSGWVNFNVYSLRQGIRRVIWSG